MESSDQPGFVIEVRDVTLRATVATHHFTKTQLQALSLWSDIESLSQGQCLILSDQEARKLAVLPHLDITRPNTEFWIHPHPALNTLPYEVHTGRELPLMLNGKKPLAVFHDAYPGFDDPWIFPEDAFQPYVDAGRLIQFDYVEFSNIPMPPPFRGLRRLMYALPGEEWRFDAYLALMSRLATVGWSDESEREEGRLLGYSDWEIEVHMNRRFPRMCVPPSDL